MCTPYITQFIIRLYATCSHIFSTFLFHLFPFDISLLPFRKAAIIWYMVNKELLEAYTTALLDHTHSSNPFYRPSFLFNDPKENRKVLSTIEDELKTCDSFFFSVAFITKSGIAPLLGTLKELEANNIQGKILTTDYLSFSEPEALEKLHSLKNIEVRMYRTEDSNVGFHTKGYIFQHGSEYHMIIGSSNMTARALTCNQEWNTKFISSDDGEMGHQIISAFYDLWNDQEHTKTYREFIENYRYLYTKRKIIEHQISTSLDESKIDQIQLRLRPNPMQVAFVNNVEALIRQGKKRFLLVSATGTGKTYASAFAMKELQAKHVLFLGHREQILKQSIKSYRKVFGNSKTFGLLSGTSKQYDVDYLFATVQTISKPEVYSQFHPAYFDAIIFDECHHAGAETYQRILNYFQPVYSLGMTATPDTITGYDIYALFDHNIAYEVRLQDALEQDLLCPFHYYGISEITVEGKLLDDVAGFNSLVCDERVQHIISNAEYYGFSGNRVKGLIFCSRKEEAYELSHKFNLRSYKTTVLTGEDSQTVREEMITRLCDDEIAETQQLDYIFTVDIFNEGVDLPEVNQIILLRPTQSPVVFTQQLGRGLRKHENKEYVVVLDFIGNYTNNYMIPIALSGDISCNKDNLRHYVLESTRCIPGSSTVHFDEISRKRIFSAIDHAKLNTIQDIKKHYTNLKYRLGRIPSLLDFDRYGELDPLCIFDNNSLGSYHAFLNKYEKEYTVSFTQQQEMILTFVSKKLANGKRIHELWILQYLLEHPDDTGGVFHALQAEMPVSNLLRKNLTAILTNQFLSGTGKNTFKDCIFIEPSNDDYIISQSFQKMIQSKAFVKSLKETVAFGMSRYRRDYQNTYKDTNLVLNRKYTYEDVCRLLNWNKQEVAQNIGGYKFDATTKTFPVFINYEKTDDISDTIKYEDRFLENDRLIAISKSRRTLSSMDVQNFLYAKQRGISVYLFVRKNKDDNISKEFYFLGEMSATGNTETITMPNTDASAVEIEWKLDVPVRDDMYEYITTK